MIRKLFDKVRNFISDLVGRKGEEEGSSRGIFSMFDKAKTVAPKAISTKTQYWYGRVNFWAKDKDLLKKEVKFMKSRGVSGYIIEMAGWRSSADDLRQDPSSKKYKKAISKIESCYKTLIGLCRKNGLWLFAGIVNDNALSTKHGNKAVDPKHYYSNVANDLLKIVLENGPENLIIQPISELYSSRVKNHPGPAWQKKTVAKLKSLGYLTCNNDGYGSPKGCGSCNYMAWHPDKISELPGKNAKKATTFIVSDTGGIISELNGGTDCDKEDADCKPSVVKKWKSNCKGYAVCGYYDFKRKSYNKAAIKAMGSV